MYDIPILMLHTVNNKPEQNPMGVLSVSAEGLEAYLKVFKAWKYQMISMDDFIRGNYDKNQNFAILTFDDGYKDNLTVALPILKKYNAKATIFVNPQYCSDKSDDSDWGFMTWEEVEQAQASGVFDIQAHTMTHAFVFTSDRIVDYYTPEKFTKYYWLAWMLYTDAPKHWDSSANRYRDMIPTGYPIFEYGRKIAQKRYIPNPQYVEYLIAKYNGTSGGVCFNDVHGEYETAQEYEQHVRWEIEACKRELEEKLQKEIHTVCFPGGGYTDFALDVAEKSGYKCYMTSSRKRIGNNFDHAKEMDQGAFVGLNRTSFSLIHPGFLPDAFFDYWIAKLSLGTYQNKPIYVAMKNLLSKVLHV